MSDGQGISTNSVIYSTQQDTGIRQGYGIRQLPGRRQVVRSLGDSI